ncbi:TolC family protein [Mucilaginibacter lacusdianchii]|uniref:TolC family protein n=1 Tax=Mucilaginibacter lacusdianchii TaxID=2684211 RepID=UPI00131E52A3|nr:TolC family protein [Mucilaginibacter sp. JXJ CY 39]
MFNRITISAIFAFGASVVTASSAFSQIQSLGMKDAIRLGLENYPTIQARQNQLKASQSYLKETKTEYLPDWNFSAQQDYGTVNGQNGPLFGYRGLSVASSGPAQPTQNWNAAFGALYLTNVNWDFFTFGRALEKIKVQQNVVNRDKADLGQQQFQHEVRVASAYLNLLAAQRLVKVQGDNLNRTLEIRRVVVARVSNGLNPGVDSSLANAEVSNARIQLTNAQQNEQEQVNQLSQYLGLPTPPPDFLLDSAFIVKNPTNPDPASKINLDNHPILQFYRNRVNVSNEQAKYLKTFAYPTFSLFGVFQGRGSGFQSAVQNEPLAYTSSYSRGIDPTRYNYLVGIATVWNFTSLFRTKYQVQSQKFTSLQYQDEYNQVSQQLQNQQALAETRINNAIRNSVEAPQQIKAANDAYVQKTTLYRNGLANITDLQQALFTLYRAETNNYIAYNNVWQALLFKAASTGDFDLFINNF